MKYKLIIFILFFIIFLYTMYMNVYCSIIKHFEYYAIYLRAQ